MFPKKSYTQTFKSSGCLDCQGEVDLPVHFIVLLYICCYAKVQNVFYTPLITWKLQGNL